MAKGPSGQGHSGVTGDQIATYAETWVGRIHYTWGGNTLPNVDCSGFVTACLKFFQLKVPPLRPVVVSYLRYGTKVATPQRGDLCIWAGLGTSGHIGFASSPTHFVSALNPSLGCRIEPIQGSGPAGAPLSFRRISGAGGVPGSSGTGCPIQAATAGLILIGGHRLWRTMR